MRHWIVLLLLLGLAGATACEENLPRPAPLSGKGVENGATPKAAFSNGGTVIFNFPDAAALDVPEETGL